MTEKPTYEDLEHRIFKLEKDIKKYPALENNEKYRILFEKSKDAIFIIEDKTVVDCNPAAVDILGYASKAELLKKHPSELSPDNQPDGKNFFTKSKEMIDLALKKGSHRFEWDLIRANGDIFPVEVLLTTGSGKDGKKIVHTVWHDITHRKQIEKARQKEKETLSTILESTPHGIALIDNNGKYLYVNPYFTKITGYTLKDVPTKEDWFKKAYPDKEYRKKVIETWVNDSNHLGLGMDREFKITCKNNQIKYIEFRSSFLKDQRISVLTDVTSRRQSEEMIREKDRLQGVLELSGAVCHEMNQPLMSIQGYFDLILMDISKDHPLYSNISKIQAQMDRLSDITKKLMEISRYETKDYLEKKIVDLTKASTTKR
ncbi:MAG: PAS domain S-box protein [Proteobacteria bacterium]|nr:PAS domain S-box protein [Pseudomonadota bacterium]MBU1583895.1 PAS domain S-box protein [Pseudomonadota bacterium]MBU2451937.1 PAS domain S-box protein [Pseudomonadota bacterium]MBU2628024.1 PAS domain S-box protein [Pseudomonadota bacterium]